MRVHVEPGEPGWREREGVDDAGAQTSRLGPLGDRHRGRPMSASSGALQDENLISRHGKPLSRPGL